MGMGTARMAGPQGRANDKWEVHKLAIISIVILFVYDCYYETRIPAVRLKKPKFSLLGPYDTAQAKTTDVYNQLIDITNFTFKVNPQPCKEYTEGLLLVIIVASNPSNFDNRVIIRNTWGKSVDSTKVVFLLGESKNESITKSIEAESKKFGDIVQGNFVDAYRNMTYKHVMGLKWVAHHCSTAKYVLKADDDIVVNARSMRRFLAKELSPWGAKDLIFCQTCEHALPYRTNSSKWRVSIKEYEQKYYPPYCAGWAILYSQNVVRKLLEATQLSPFFWIDDVHITGVMAQKVGITPTSMSGLFLTALKADLLIALKDLPYSKTLQHMDKYIVGPTNLKTGQMMQIWKAIPA